MAKQERQGVMSLPARARFEQRATQAWFTERHGSANSRENHFESKTKTPSDEKVVFRPGDWFSFRHGVLE